MKSKITLTALVCGLLLSSAALAQDSSQGVSLATVRGTFRKADADGDGAITAREAARARIPAKHFVAHDVDANRSLTQEEFVAYYRELLVKARRPVGKDLEAEVARVETLRRAKLAEQERQRAANEAGSTVSPVVAQRTAEKLKAAQGTLAKREQASSGSRTEIQQAMDTLGDTGTSSLTTSEKLKRAKDALEGRWQATGSPRAKVQRAIDVLEERAAAAETPVQKPALVETPVSVEEPALKKVAASGNVSGDAPDSGATATGETADSGGLSDARRKLIERARNARANDTPAGNPTANATNAPPRERARAILRRLVESGRITPDQARDFDAMLADRAAATTGGNTTPIADVNALRATLRRAQAQVKGQHESGAMTAEEARLVNDALVARARIIASTLPPTARASVPVEPDSVRQETRRVTTAAEESSPERESRATQEQPVPAQGAAPVRGREPAGREVGPKDAEVRDRPATKPSTSDVKGVKPADDPADDKGARPDTRKEPEAKQSDTTPPVRGAGRRGDGGQDSGARRSGDASTGGRRVGGEV